MLITYKLSNLAAKDFEGIFECTLVNFGIRKADEYTKFLPEWNLIRADPTCC